MIGHRIRQHQRALFAESDLVVEFDRFCAEQATRIRQTEGHRLRCWTNVYRHRRSEEYEVESRGLGRSVVNTLSLEFREASRKGDEKDETAHDGSTRMATHAGEANSDETALIPAAVQPCDRWMFAAAGEY